MLDIFIGIASTGRNSIINSTLEHVAKQTTPPKQVIICTPTDEDYIIGVNKYRLPIEQIKYQKGSCPQRNAILDVLGRRDGILLIIDDDFLLHKDYLRQLALLGDMHPDVALFNGTILKDGISGPGLAVDEASVVLNFYRSCIHNPPRITDKVVAYGCNMAIRLKHSWNVRFDENLPLYGWQEDVDYSARLRAHGRIVQTNVISGIHLGTKHGRTSGVRFGYSQIVNPIYLVNKGTMSLQHCMQLIAKNIVMNLIKSIHPENYIDRRGRLKGNCIALKDCAIGRVDPMRIISLN